MLKKTLYLLLVCSITSIIAQRLPSGFQNQQITPLSFPTAISFAPDGRAFLAEQAGSVRILKGGRLLSSPFVTLDSVFSNLEKGLLGIEFDPDFINNGYIYFYYTVNLSGNRIGGTLLPGSPVRNKIVRYTANGDVALAGSKTTILDLDVIPSFIVNYNHDGGSMRFGPDGKLYVATGENTLWCSSQCMNSFSTGCNCGPVWIPSNWSQELTSYHGKILRMNPDGSAPADNPFVNSTVTSIQKRYIYALGMRNPFTMHFRPGTSDLYFNDVGSGDGSSAITAEEEINVLSSTSVKNYGWPIVEGPANQPNLYTDPIKYYNHRLYSGGSRSTPGTTTTGCAITGGVFYQPSNSNWPSNYLNKYFYLDFCDGWINTLDVDNGNAVANFATSLAGNYTNSSSGGYGSIHLEVGPDAQLYYLVRSSAANVSGLYRISYQANPLTSISITTTGLNINSCGGSLQMGYSVAPSNASVNHVLWTAAPSNLATIDANGMLTALNNGVVTVTAVSSANYAISITSLVNISNQQLTNSLTIVGPGNSAPAITVDKGTVQLSMLQNGCSGANNGFYYSILRSSAGVVATISSTGMLQSLGNNGNVTIAGFANGNPGISARVVIPITNQFVPVNSVGLTASSTTFTPSINVITVAASINPSNATQNGVTWAFQTSTTYVAQTVTGNYLIVTILGKSMTDQIKVTATSISNVTATSEINLVIQNKIVVTSVIATTSNSSGITTAVGVVTLTGSVTPSNATNTTVLWRLTKGSSAIQLTTLPGNKLTLSTTTEVIDTAIVQVYSEDNPSITYNVTIYVKNKIISIPIINVTGIEVSLLNPSGIFSPDNPITVTGVVTPSNATNTNILWKVLDGQSIVSVTTLSGNKIRLTSSIQNADTVTMQAYSEMNNSIQNTFLVPINIPLAVKKQQLSNNPILQIYPNPNNGIMTLYSTVLKGHLDYALFNVNGTLVHNDQIANFTGTNELRLNGVAKGMYLLILSDGKANFREIIVIE